MLWQVNQCWNLVTEEMLVVEHVDTKGVVMRLTKRQLKRIIREEYSRLKRRGLIKESSWQFNPAMGEDGQDCEEGTTIEQCAQTWGQYARDSYGDGAIQDIQDYVRPSKRGGGADVIDMAGDDTDAGYACSECLEGMDINGSGNWPREEAAAALADVFVAMR